MNCCEYQHHYHTDTFYAGPRWLSSASLPLPLLLFLFPSQSVRQASGIGINCEANTGRIHYTPPPHPFITFNLSTHRRLRLRFLWRRVVAIIIILVVCIKQIVARTSRSTQLCFFRTSTDTHWQIVRRIGRISGWGKGVQQLCHSETIEEYRIHPLCNINSVPIVFATTADGIMGSGVLYSLPIHSSESI